MKLIQLSETQLARLILCRGELNDLVLIEGSIPPEHVLQRSMKLMSHRVNSILALAYLIQNNSKIIGCCGFKSSPNNSRIEIGYNVAPSARGLGTATLAVKRLCKIAFDSGEVVTVVALIAPENRASLKVVQKNNFSYLELVIDEEGEQLACWALNKPICK